MGVVKLRNCPFCYERTYISLMASWDDVKKPYYVICNACGGRSGYYYSKESAIKAWNGEWDKDEHNED